MKSLTLSRLLYLVYLFLVGFPVLFLLTSLCCILLIAASYLHVPASFISRVTKVWSWSGSYAVPCRGAGTRTPPFIVCSLCRGGESSERL